MQQIGYSLIDLDNIEVLFWGDRPGEKRLLPDFIVLPNGDTVHAPKSGETYSDYTIVERWCEYDSKLSAQKTGETVFFDGEKIIVTFEYRQPYQSELLAYSASKRYEKEVGGITVDGYSIYTDRQSQSMLTGIVTLMQLKPNTVISFKTANGFISANTTIINDIAISVANHIESCFNLENDVASEIQANTIVTFTQIDDKY